MQWLVFGWMHGEVNTGRVAVPILAIKLARNLFIVSGLVGSLFGYALGLCATCNP